MNNKNSILGSPYDEIVCAYACPTTEWNPYKPGEDWIDSLVTDINKDMNKDSLGYEISGNTITFHNIDSSEKIIKLIEVYETLKDK